MFDPPGRSGTSLKLTRISCDMITWGTSGCMCVSLCSCMGPQVSLRAWECIDFFFYYSLLTLRRKGSSGLEKKKKA